MLIITMGVQPVMFSYAMANMDHSHHQASVVAGQNHDGHHVMHDDVSLAEPQDADTGALNDCCNSAACCPAAVADIDVMLHEPNTLSFVSSHTSWEGIDLPAEVKPPRSLLG